MSASAWKNSITRRFTFRYPKIATRTRGSTAGASLAAAGMISRRTSGCALKGRVLSTAGSPVSFSTASRVGCVWTTTARALRTPQAVMGKLSAMKSMKRCCFQYSLPAVTPGWP